jgi:hypothetical protein
MIKVPFLRFLRVVRRCSSSPVYDGMFDGK